MDIQSTQQVRIPRAELGPGQIRRVLLDGQAVAVANVEGEIFAVSDTCTHARVSLSGGHLEGRQIVCPWHYAMFDLKSGRPTCGPAHDPLRCYTARIDGDEIIVEAPAD
jgi:nitrite reductase/ring-hydroxylating ferredoxin subunit